MAELRLTASVERLPEVISFLEEQMELAEASMKATMQTSIAVEEMYVNVASYAYAPGTGEAIIRVEFTEEDGAKMAVITLIDHGMPYDPLAKEDPDVTLSAEERQIGGLGIYMVKKSMDFLGYEYVDGDNVLTIKKKI